MDNMTSLRIWFIRFLLPTDWYTRKEYAQALLPRGRRLPVETRRKKDRGITPIEEAANAH